LGTAQEQQNDNTTAPQVQRKGNVATTQEQHNISFTAALQQQKRPSKNY
jgi:hypothetical protein